MSGRKIPYPWGRIRPEKRIDEIEGMIEKLKRQKDVLALQLEDSLKKIDMNISALQGQVDVARSFEKEDEWSLLRERVYDLQMIGIDAMQMIYGKTISEAQVMVARLEEESVAVDDDQEISSNEDDFLTSSIDGIDDIFDGE